MTSIKPVQAILDNFRRSSLGRSLLPLGTTTGLPFPYVRKERPYILLPLIEKAESDVAKDEKRLPIKKPVGEVRFDLWNGRLVKYQLYLCDDPLHQEPDNSVYAWFPPGPAIQEGWTKSKYEEQLALLYELLPEAVLVLLHDGSSSGGINRFLTQFYRLLPSGLEKFYKAILDETSFSIGTHSTRNSHPPIHTPFD